MYVQIVSKRESQSLSKITLCKYFTCTEDTVFPILCLGHKGIHFCKQLQFSVFKNYPQIVQKFPYYPVKRAPVLITVTVRYMHEMQECALVREYLHVGNSQHEIYIDLTVFIYRSELSQHLQWIFGII